MKHYRRSKTHANTENKVMNVDCHYAGQRTYTSDHDEDLVFKSYQSLFLGVISWSNFTSEKDI